MISMHILRTAFRAIDRQTRLNTAAFLYFAVGCFFGALTNKFNDNVLIFSTLLIIVFLVERAYNFYQSNNVSGFTPWEMTLRDPTDAALRVCEQANENYLVVGGAIEILTHPQLNGRADVTQLGWAPETVNLIDRQVQFDSAISVGAARGPKTFDPPNGIKYSLVQTSLVLSDTPALEITVAKTDYFTVKTVLNLIQASPTERATLGKLLPENNLIPHSLCLHFLVRFSNGDVLCMQRDNKLGYHGGTWSFSGEEQLSDLDFRHENPCLALFQRTVCEEVLPLREETTLSDRWRIAAEVIDSMALWSIFLEEAIHNYS